MVDWVWDPWAVKVYNWWYHLVRQSGSGDGTEPMVAFGQKQAVDGAISK